MQRWRIKKMYDSYFCSKYAAEYVAIKINKGSRPYHEIILLEERLEQIKKLFIKRFGKPRASKLINEIDNWASF